MAIEYATPNGGGDIDLLHAEYNHGELMNSISPMLEKISATLTGEKTPTD
jgi:hypothetical protein